MRIGEVRFLRFSVRESAGSRGIVESKSLQQFGVVIELAAVPQPRVEVQAVAPRLLRLRRGRKAVGSAIWRTKAWITLRQIGGLAVDFPTSGFRIDQRRELRRAAIGRPVDLAVEADAERLEVQRRC